MRLGNEQGTLTVPFWLFTPWWPLLSPSPGVFHPFVVDWRANPLHETTFPLDLQPADLFGHGIPSCRVFGLGNLFFLAGL